MDNPTNLKGFAFLEFSSPNDALLATQFESLGFTKTGSYQHAAIDVYQQGNIYFLLNRDQNSQAQRHATKHGAGACSMGFLFEDANKAYDYVIKQGGKPYAKESDANALPWPAIEAIGGSLIYFVDNKSRFTELQDFKFDTPARFDLFNEIDHLTHNVYRGNMDKWAKFYFDLFNFHEIRFFDIKGQHSGLISRALASPNGKIKIPLNESSDDNSQIEEFLTLYNGEGIQHIALSTDDIYQAVEALEKNNIDFLDVPDTYYEALKNRIPWHQENINRLKQDKILIDGEPQQETGLLLQIFTENMLGPVFFELIQRKGNDGFGEGNFQALFEAIERDQIKRGILKEKKKD